MPVPMTEPMIVPRPPNRLAPPMTTAAIALRLSVAPESGRARAEARHHQHRGHPGEDPGERVDLQQVAAVVDAGPDDRLPAVADAQRVRAEPRPGQQQAAPDRDDGRDQHGHRYPPAEVVVAEGGDRARDGRDLLPVVEQVAEAGRDAQRAERDHERRDARPRHQEPVDQAERQASGHCGGEPEGDRPDLGPGRLAGRELRHHPGACRPGETEHRPDRQVDAAGADHERLADREQQHLGPRARGVQPVGAGQEVRRVDAERHDERQQHPADPQVADGRPAAVPERPVPRAPPRRAPGPTSAAITPHLPASPR